MTEKEKNECIELLGFYFPSHGVPFKVLLGGLLKESDLDKLEELTEHDRGLVRTFPNGVYML
jgi:hypothetical protein